MIESPKASGPVPVAMASVAGAGIQIRRTAIHIPSDVRKGRIVGHRDRHELPAPIIEIGWTRVLPGALHFHP